MSGHGCPGNDYACHSYCVDHVINNGNRPCGGGCGGLFWATCQCYYSPCK